MKKYLILILSIWTLTAYPQGIQTVKVRACSTCPVLYLAKTVRNITTYPLTQAGADAFAAAATSGAFSMTLDNGAVIPAGTLPPRLPPNPSTVSWLTSARYSYNVTTKRLFVEAAGEAVTMRFERLDGAALTGSNTDGGVLNNTTFFGAGPQTGQGNYDKRWEFAKNNDSTGGIPSGTTIKLTFKQPVTAITVSYTLSTASTVTRVLLTNPATAPPTSTTVVSPSWITQLRYTLAGGVMTLEGAGQIGQVKFEHVDGSTFTTTNPNNVTINSGTYYGYGPLTGQGIFDRQWTINTATVPFKVTLNKEGDASTTFPVSFTPVDGASRVTLALSTTVDNGSNPTPPAWLSARYTYANNQLNVEGAPVNSSGITLSIRRADNAALSIQSSGGQALTAGTYYPSGTLSGQGLFTQEWSFYPTSGGGGVPSVPIVLTWKQTDNSTYSYTFTPTANTRQTMFTASTSTGPGSGTATGTDADGFLTYTNAGGSGVKYIENSQIKVGFDLESGGVIVYAALKSDGINRVNAYKVIYHDNPADPRYNTEIYEKGRDVMFFSDYFTPGPQPNGYTVNGKNTKIGYHGFNDQPNVFHVFNTGANTVQGGNLEPSSQGSPVLKNAVVSDSRGQVLCLRVQPYIWGISGELGHILGDQEVWLDGTAICYKARHIIQDRGINGQNIPEQRTYQSQEQENPCMYVLANMTQHNINLDGSIVNRYPTNWTADNPFSKTIYTSGCWIGAYPGDGQNGLTWYSPDNAAVRSGQFVGTVGGSADNACSYINSAYSINYDNPGTYIDRGFIILGNQSNALAKIATLPAINQSFDFDFTKDNHRWNNRDCRGIRENGQYKIYIGELNQDNSANGLFSSPARAWQASNITNLEFRMTTSNVSKLWLYWHKPGEENDDSKRYRKAITVTNGTFTVPTSDPNWNGTISWVGLGAIRNGDPDQGGNPATPSSAYIIPTRIRSVP